MKPFEAGIVIAFVSAILLSALVVQSAPSTAPATQPADADLIAFRKKTPIARLPLMRAAVKEAGLSDDNRDKILGIIDDADQKLHDLLDEYASSPNQSADEWEQKRDQIAKDFEAQAKPIISDRGVNDAINRSMLSIETEMSAMRMGKLIDAMSKLDLTDDEQTKLKSIADQTADKLAHPSTTNPSTSIPDAERRQEILLAAHQQIRDVLTEDQKSQWTTLLVNRSQSHPVLRAPIVRPAPRPAP